VGIRVQIPANQPQHAEALEEEQQASGGGGGVETERATYKHDAEAVDEVAAELQDGVRCMVQCNLESATWEQLGWSKAGFSNTHERGTTGG
jgi:hypothetical protein